MFGQKERKKCDPNIETNITIRKPTNIDTKVEQKYEIHHIDGMEQKDCISDF